MVVDGDTLRFGAERVRLWGIDAPELSEDCTRADRSEWSCGKAARAPPHRTDQWIGRFCAGAGSVTSTVGSSPSAGQGERTWPSPSCSKASPSPGAITRLRKLRRGANRSAYGLVPHQCGRWDGDIDRRNGIALMGIVPAPRDSSVSFWRGRTECFGGARWRWTRSIGKFWPCCKRTRPLPVAEIGRKVGLSTTPCWRRIQKMEEDGVIKRRVAVLDPAKVNAGVTVFMAVRTNEHSDSWLRKFAARRSRISPR